MNNQNFSESRGSNNKPVIIRKDHSAVIYLFFAIVSQILIILFAFNAIATKSNDLMFVGFFYLFVTFVLSAISSVFYLLLFRVRKISLWFTILTFLASLAIYFLSFNYLAPSYYRWQDNRIIRNFIQNINNNVQISQETTDQPISFDKNSAIFNLANQYYTYNYTTSSFQKINQIQKNVVFSNDKNYFALTSNSETGVINIFKNGDSQYWKINLLNIRNEQVKVFSENSQYFLFSMDDIKGQNPILGRRAGYGIVNLKTSQVEFIETNQIDNKIKELWPGYSGCNIGDIEAKLYNPKTLDCPYYKNDNLYRKAFEYNKQMFGPSTSPMPIIDQNQEWQYTVMDTNYDTTNIKQEAIFKINLKTNEKDLIFGPFSSDDGAITHELSIANNNLFFLFNSKKPKESVQIYGYNSDKGLQKLFETGSLSNFRLVAE
ncbi:MAG: hypothetical protein M1429_00040 [Patescibacteria group bacterium]|nr:hypothetical protein [Patescibacteria group bacterium]